MSIDLQTFYIRALYALKTGALTSKIRIVGQRNFVHFSDTEFE